MKKIIIDKNGKRSYSGSKKKKWTFFVILLTIIGGLSLLYYYLDPHRQFTIIVPCHLEAKKEDEKLSNNKTISEQETSFTLRDKINNHQEVLKTLTDPKGKENLQKIITFLEKKERSYQQKKNIQTYLFHSKEALKEKDSKINNKLPLAEKHFLTEEKLKQEKEVLYLEEKEKAWQEKEELEQILKGIVEKLKNSSLTTQERTNLMKDKENLETKRDKLGQEIEKISNQIQIRNRIETLTKESEQTTDETIQACYQAEKERLTAQLEMWQ
ncbi:MAG: hypothetical protein Q8779_02440 [Candidatus Phytoplasma stylosanthis]|uniref:hypothetical protein n=1 Tax=Candidatus Phytoplasma stylosanthis TaxID=2798314 RepID=UPI0029397C51|nr:hypothetical protein [Candidatus Phytoplasma stylosanthis]MDV3174397.1 hypothetical protein [Candidatus Phytoplasma stylosanthis]